MYQRWTLVQSTEIKYAIDKLEEYIEGGDRGAVELGLAQLRATYDTYAYRKQHSAKPVDHDPNAGFEIR